MVVVQQRCVCLCPDEVAARVTFNPETEYSSFFFSFFFFFPFSLHIVIFFLHLNNQNIDREQQNNNNSDNHKIKSTQNSGWPFAKSAFVTIAEAEKKAV